MKAVLALVIIYVGTFFLVILGASQNPVQAVPQGTALGNAALPQANSPVDPAKEADIRSLMELVGARELVEDGENTAIQQSREKVLATLPNNDKGPSNKPRDSRIRNSANRNSRSSLSHGKRFFIFMSIPNVPF